ncbi:hypothetical protein INT44_000019 [Umbelopsis vinacea]|uniref:Guanine nucleotide-binding protein-like 3 N-terminal domain-containing protein n=1 Tax=Umbelopsis vinacea TaxID=44442 RepID=A0A8H7PH62_9FUNG|nr:hypothetical protein INT44_000019 [Umbelopsis vinacea]KAI9287866.1 GNL3L/Grn1 putative GTPase-domain-containing protein [Umbelopsis sp. AD052]
MVPKKRMSKRMSCAKRYKNEKRAKEHNRKLKRDAKKNPHHSNKSKKDPGIPNSWPFKEQLLNEIEERKQKMLQEKEDKKKANQAKRLKAKEAKKANNTPAA